MPWDPGLQVERTMYAWVRTCLSMALASGAAIKLASVQGRTAAEVMAAVAMCGWFALTVLAWRRAGKRSRDLIRGRPYKTIVNLQAATANAVLLSVAVLMLIEL